MRESGLALRSASAALRGDPEVVRAAVEENGQALEFAAEGLQDDRHLGNGLGFLGGNFGGFGGVGAFFFSEDLILTDL